MAEQKTIPQFFVTNVIDPNNPVPEGIVADPLFFLAGTGQYIRLYGSSEIKRGKTYRIYAKVTDWSLSNEREPLARPVIEISYFNEEGEHTVVVRDFMFNDRGSGQVVSGAIYFYEYEIPKDKSIKHIQMTAVVSAPSTEALAGLVEDALDIPEIVGGVITGDPSEFRLNLAALSLITPSIDTFDLDIAAHDKKLDVLGISTRGLIQYK